MSTESPHLNPSSLRLGLTPNLSKSRDGQRQSSLAEIDHAPKACTICSEMSVSYVPIY